MASSQEEKLLNHLAHRGALLSQIREGITDSKSIARNIGKSRSSVDRDIRLLKTDGYIRENPDGYYLTKYGEFAHYLHQMASQIDAGKRLIPHLPSNPPLALLEDSVVRETGGTFPREPILHRNELIEDASEIKITLRAVFPTFIRSLIEQVQAESLTVELVTGDKVFDELCRKYTGLVDVSSENECISVRKTSGYLSCGLVVADEETMCLSVYDDSSRLLGTITTDSNDAVEWAIDQYRDHRSECTEVLSSLQSRQEQGHRANHI